MTEMTNRALAKLAFWAKGMVQINNAKMDWPGFSYSDHEWSRMRALSAPIDDATYRKFTVVNAAIFIALAAVGIGCVFIPLATLLFPVPAETSALKFSLLLATCCFLIIGLGLPISMGISASLLTTRSIRDALVPAPEDVALAGKVSWQINRIMLVMCGLLVPGMLLFITYDIDAGPIITAIKWVAIVLMAFSVLAGAARRRKG